MMTSPGKNVYLISIIDSNNQMQSYCIVATTMAAALTQAQTAAGVTHDATTVQKANGPIQYEV